MKFRLLPLCWMYCHKILHYVFLLNIQICWYHVSFVALNISWNLCEHKSEAHTTRHTVGSENKFDRRVLKMMGFVSCPYVHSSLLEYAALIVYFFVIVNVICFTLTKLKLVTFSQLLILNNWSYILSCIYKTDEKQKIKAWARNSLSMSVCTYTRN